MRVTLGLSVALFATFAWAQSTPTITEYPLGVPFTGYITPGPGGVLWITPGSQKLGTFSPSGGFASLANVQINGMVAGPDGALWYTQTGFSGTNDSAIGRITTAGVITMYPVPAANGSATAITAGPDGALWFTGSLGRIGRITTSGNLTEYNIPSAQTGSAGNQPVALPAITVGPDGALWFTDFGAGVIREITTSGVVTDVATVGPSSGLSGIVTGSDGALWFTEHAVGRIGRVTTSGTVTEFALPAGGVPEGITPGPDGAVWFTDRLGAIGRITPAGVITEYSIPNPNAKNLDPFGIAVGPDGALWFTEYGGSNVGRVQLSSSAPLQILSANLLPATVNVAYAWLLTANGGAPPYTWSASGSLPAGLSLSSNGSISGTPTAGGNFTFSVTVTDSASATATATVGIVVNTPACSYVVSNNITTSGFSPAGGPLGFGVSVNPGCAWTVVGNIPSWIVPVPNTVTTGGTGTGSVAFTIAPNYTTSARSATFTVAGVSETVQQQTGLFPSFGFMPHLAAEGGWRTTFTIVNESALAESTTLALTDNNGNPLPLPITLPQQPSTPAATESSAVQTIPGNGLAVVEASGPANVPFLEGAATNTSTGATNGFAIFHYDPSGQEAVVPLQNSQAGVYNGDAVQLTIPFDNTNGVQTGIAVQMTNGNFVGVTLLDDSGAQIGTGMESLTLPANGHVSFVLSTQFPETANKRGILMLTGACAYAGGLGPVTICSEFQALGIRYTPPGTLTTLPALVTAAVPLGEPPQPLLSTPGTIAHIASGNGWQTTFVLINSGLDPNPATLNFYDDNGNPLSLPLTILETGQTITASSITQSVPGSLWIQTSGDVGTPLLTGSAQLVSSNASSAHSFGALAIFRYNPNGQEAVSPLQVAPTSTSSASLLAFDNTNSTATGVAISNGSAQAVSVPVVIRDDLGNQIGTDTLSLPANGHTSYMLASQYPATANIRGTLEFDIPGAFTASPATIGVLGIRSPPQLTFTTLPALAR